MNTKRKVIAIARHGFTPNGANGLSLDSLTDESVQHMYEQGIGLGESVQTGRVFILHSDKNRTITTAKARLAGERGLSPKPSTQEDLGGFDFDGTLFIRDERLSYENLDMNYGAIEEMGLPEYTKWMLANRHATEIGGKPVTSFQEIYDTRKPVLGDAVRRMDAGNYDLGFISTHGVITDAITMAAADSARGKPIDSYKDIGGQFKKEDAAHLVIDTKEKSGTSTAKIVRGNLVLPVNIGRIRAGY